MPNITRLHHVQITVPSAEVERARAFYCGVLGLVEIEKPDSLKDRGGFWMQLGDVDVHVGVEDGVARQSLKAHVAYQVDDLTAWRAVLLAHGVTILESTPIPGYTRFEFRDPFGNRMEFIQPLSASVDGSD